MRGTKRSKREAEAREDLPGQPARLDLAYYPLVPEDSRPREIVFDSLHMLDVEELKTRGYAPVLLRILPRRTEREEDIYMQFMMQGVSEGTIQIDKSRAEGLFLELKSRGRLDKRQFDSKPKSAVQEEGIEAALDWAGSRHVFTGNTTIVEPTKVMDFIRAVQSHRAAEEAKKPAKRKRDVE